MPERIAVKWRYIDVTVFKALPRIPENCPFVIEAKRLGAGVEGALVEQIMGHTGSGETASRYQSAASIGRKYEALRLAAESGSVLEVVAGS